MKLTLLMMALGFACALSQAQTKAPKPKPAPPPVVQPAAPVVDVLADLKAEFEYQQTKMAPVLVLYKAAQDKHMACINESFRSPLTTDCRWDERDLLIVARAAKPYADKLIAAQEAYEREVRRQGVK
jgi:hypothetical protein